MTPEQAIKYMIIGWANALDGLETLADLTGEQVNEMYDVLVENEEHYDGRSEIRASGFDTDIPCEDSRHYESKSVAAQAPNGQWVGWTYWYGGGKHGEPEAIDWMEHAYFLDVTEEQKVVTVRTFKKQEQE